MAYDLGLAKRLDALLADEPGVTRKKMFGGLAFLVGGHLAVSASGQGGLLLRVDPADGEVLAGNPAVSPFVMRGREVAGWLRVDVRPSTADDELAGWVRRGVDYARSLPPRSP